MSAPYFTPHPFLIVIMIIRGKGFKKKHEVHMLYAAIETNLRPLKIAVHIPAVSVSFSPFFVCFRILQLGL